MNAVPAGAAAYQYENVTNTSHGVLQQLVAAHEPDAADVDEAVARVRRIEEDAAGNGRDADAVPVVADARHHSSDEVLGQLHPGRRLSKFRRPEEQRIDQGDGLRAHGQNVAHDSTDAGGRSSVRLDGRRMVVAFHPERISMLVVEDHDPRVALGQYVGVLDGEYVLAKEHLG